jgi:peptidoglycan/xylan/chitin deacetylase (PgdA/CDA1 family)
MTSPARPPSTRTGRHITILTYHSIDTSGSVISISPARFAAHMSAVARLGFRGVSLREAMTHRSRHGSWPIHSVVLTFDDGYANVVDEALPILQRHGFDATVFIVTRHLGGTNDWAPPPAYLGSRPMLSASQIRQLSAAGVEIGGHTRTHPDLCAATAARVEDEVVGCRADVEAELRQPVQSFAYPYGSISDVAVAATRRTFDAACTTELRRTRDDDPHLLPRVDAYYIRSGRMLEQVLSGRLDWYLTLRRCARGIRHGVFMSDGSPEGA